MSKAPDRCLYCDGTNPDCGFCDMGRPLDTQEDWDRTWGRVLPGGEVVRVKTTITFEFDVPLSAYGEGCTFDYIREAETENVVANVSSAIDDDTCTIGVEVWKRSAEHRNVESPNA